MASCRGAHWVVSWPPPRPCHRRPLSCCSFPARDTKIVSRHRAPAARVPRALLCVSQRSSVVSQGAAAPYRSLAALYRDPKVTPSVTIQNFVSRPSASQAMRARPLLHALAGGPAVSWPVSAVSWHLLDRIVAES